MKSAKTKNQKDGKSKKERIKEELFFSGSDDEPFPEIECDLCSKKFLSVSMYEQHLSSKKHYQMLTKQKMKQKVDDLQKEGVETTENKDDDDLDEELHCDICQKSFSGYIPFAAHIKGSFHGKKVKKLELKESFKDFPGVLGDKELEDLDDDIMQKPFARCTTCAKHFNDPRALKQHLEGPSHKKTLQKVELMEKLRSELPGDFHVEDENDEFFSKCSVCNKSFSGPVPYKMHLLSSVHLKELKKVETAEDLKAFFVKDSTGKLVCNVCNKGFPDAMALKSHLDNNSHGKRRIKDELFDFVTSNPEIVAVKAVQNVSSEEENDEDVNYKNGHYFLVCKLCHLSFSGPESAKDHVQSKKHIKVKREKAERKALAEKFKDKSKEHGQANNNLLKHDKNGLTADGTVDAAISSSATNDSKTETSDDFELI